MLTKKRYIGITLCCGSVLSGPAVAQTVPAPPSAIPAPGATTKVGSGTTEEVVVTARRRSESLQKVPVAIIALSQATLRQQSVYNAYDLNKTVPGLTVGYTQPGITNFAIRGRGQSYGAAAGDVETYFADVPLSGPANAPVLPLQFFDLQSVQALKGPQGTLFGRSTTGGAVLEVPQAPTQDFGGYVRLQGGTYGDFQGEGAINVPLQTDKAALRIAFFDWQRDGYSHTTAGTTETLTGETLPSQRYNNIDEQEVRATLRVNPTDWFQNSTIFTYHADANIVSPGAGFLLNASRTGEIPAPGYLTRSNDTDLRLESEDYHTFAFINTSTATLSDNLTFKNILSYINAQGKVGLGQDDDATTLDTIDQLGASRSKLNQQITEEAQLQGHWFDNTLTGIAGGLVDRNYQPGQRGDIDIQSINFEGPCATTPNCNRISTVFDQNTIHSYGAYASLTYKITPKLRVTAGFRHSWDFVALYSNNTIADVLQQPGAQPPTVATGPLLYSSNSFQGNTYNADVDYDVTSNILAYAGYRHGYKRGGFNQSALGDPAVASFAPEKVDDFYIGTKANFHLGSVPVRFNIEGFYDLYRGNQVSYIALSPLFQLETITTNVNDSIYRGFDTDISIAPTPWLLITGAYSYLNAFNTRWIDTSVPASTVDLAANPVANAPVNKFSLTTRFHTDLPGNWGDVAFAPTLTYQGSFTTGVDDTVVPLAAQRLFGNFNASSFGGNRVPNYFLLDFRAEWNHIHGSEWSIAGNVTNATDKTFFLGNGTTIIFGVNPYSYGPPLLATLDITRRF